MQDLNRAMEGIARKAGGDAARLARTLLIVILPSSAAQIRTLVKHWGDVRYGMSSYSKQVIGRLLILIPGIKTQCLRENKVTTAKNQYWNNVALK